jgi:hypothetical protein
MKRCAACGQENEEWRPFCTHCGASYAAEAAEAAGPVLPPPPPGAPPAPPAPGDVLPPAASRGARPRPPAAVIALAAVLAVAVGVGAFVALAGSSKSHHAASTTTTTFPATWDARVDSLVRFDSAERGLDYAHPVKVVFLSPAAFKKRVTTDAGKLTAKDRRDLQNQLEELRALGMVQGKVDLFAKENQLSGATTEAFYDPDKKEIVVPGSTIDVEQRVTLAHELTHTLDDQHFDLNKLDKIGTKHDTDAVTALVEGDAVWVQSKYEAKLPEADRRAYERSQQTAVTPGDLKGVPQIFEVLSQWPYDFGPLFVDILREVGGQARVDAAFKSPPVDEEQVIDPLAYLNGDPPGPIAAPTLPRGAKKLDGGKEFGSLAWFQMLSERIDPHVALKATLGWGADSYTDAREGTKTCVEVRYRGETKQDNAEMLSALHLWIAALPTGMAAVTVNSDDTMQLHSCDPGEAAKVVTNRSIQAYQLLLFRDVLVDQFVKAKAPPAIATCAADAVTDRTALPELIAGKTPAVLTNKSAIAQIALTCRATADTVAGTNEIDR